MKILVIRFSSIGDIVLTSPIVRCLKKQLDANVHFLSKKEYGSLVSHNPYISKVHLLGDSLDGLMSELKQEEFDLIIDLHKNTRSKKVVHELKVKNINFDKVNIKKWLFVQSKINRLPQMHLVDRYFDALKELEIINDHAGIDFFLERGLESKVTEKIDLKKPYICIAIGGTYTTKRVPSRIALSVIKRLKNTPVLIGGSGDTVVSEVIIAGCERDDIVNLVGQLSIQESAAVIKNGTSIVTGDTGMMHIASAFDVDIHAIWGNTHPSFGMYAYRESSSPPVINYEVELPCRPCSKLGYGKCPRGHFKCMEMQNIEEIVQNCNSSILPQ